jgi:hypothetical protein
MPATRWSAPLEGDSGEAPSCHPADPISNARCSHCCQARPAFDEIVAELDLSAEQEETGRAIFADNAAVPLFDTGEIHAWAAAAVRADGPGG